MNCEHCRELLPGHERAELSPELARELSPDQQAAVSAHLQTCATCAKAALALRELNVLLDTDVQPSPGLRTQVLARLQQEAAGNRTGALSSLSTLFMALWPSRPIGAFSYSLALVLCGMLSGQLLPLGAADIPPERLYQLCPVPDAPPRDIL
jgi:anti-sigma factor RsiW